jgi:hypothetical protein
VVARLAAHLGVERSLVEDEVGVLLGLDDVDDLGLGRELRVAQELGRLLFGGGFAFGGCHDDFLFLCGAAALRVVFPSRVKSSGVDRQSALLREELRHVEREAVGVVELERRPRRENDTSSPPGSVHEVAISRLHVPSATKANWKIGSSPRSSVRPKLSPPRGSRAG